MRDSRKLVIRIARLSSRASDAPPTDGLLAEMEDLLAEGYLTALCGEAGSRRLAERLGRLIEIIDQPQAALEARRVAQEKRRLDAEVSDLRTHLGVMREQFMQLRAVSRAG